MTVRSASWSVAVGIPVVLLAVACDGPGRPRAAEPSAVAGGSEASAAPSAAAGEGVGQTLDRRWPKDLVVVSSEGPALYLGPEPDAPVVGYLSEGVRLRRAGPMGGGRAKAFVTGGMKVRGWVPLERLGLYVQRRGRLKGAPVYVGPGNLVRLVEPAGEGLFRVEARALLRAEPPVKAPPFVGVYPLDRLGVDAPAPGAAEPPRPGQPFRLVAGQAVALYARSRDTQPLFTLPAIQPPLVVEVLKDAGSRRGVRVGAGPYLVGYVDASALGEAAEGPERPAVQPEPPQRVLPERIAAERDYPLWKVREGAKVYFHRADGSRFVFAILKKEGFARELKRYDDAGEVDVFLAVDDDVAVRGLVRTEDLAPFEPPGR